MKQTAIEWLLKELDINPKATILKDLIEQAKEMEKEQIVDAYNNGQQIPPFEYVEQYYNKTFGESTPWYDEDKLTERMNVIGQNGNDGEHYKK